MPRWRRSRGSHSQDVLRAVHDLSASRTWEDVRHRLYSLPELLTEEASDWLVELARRARAEHRETAAFRFDQDRSLLVRCSKVGIDAAVREAAARSDRQGVYDIDEPLVRIVTELVFAATPDRARGLIHTHPELLTHAAERQLIEMEAIAYETRALAALRAVGARRLLLRACRSSGIDSGFTAFQAANPSWVQATEAPPELQAALWEILGEVGTLGDFAVAARRHPELLTASGDSAIADLQHLADRMGNQDMVEILRQVRLLYARIREVGIDRAIQEL